MTVTRKRTPVTTVRYELICDECGREMTRSLELMLTHPPRYRYTCMSPSDECSDLVTWDLFPRVEYEPI